MNLSAESLAKLRLIRTPGLGPISVRRLLRRYASAQAALADSAAWSKPTQALATVESIDREVENLQRAGGWLRLWGEPDFPAALADLPDAPIVLSGLGDPRTLQAQQVALVGNRAASAAGLAWSRTTAAALAAQGIVLTSGLARGVDTAVHEGALAGAPAGQPCTVAVVAGGVDHLYPPENASLRSRIIAQGCVVSEQPWGMQPIANLFPQRNRIIAGLSVGVVVSEATRHSGSLITAEYALNYGREVWAVPGSPTDPRSGGPNWLLKQGATLIEQAADILGSLPRTPAPFVARARTASQPALWEEVAAGPLNTMTDTAADADPQPRQQLYALLGSTPVSFDQLTRQLPQSEAELQGLLIELELEGHASRDADGRWRRG